VRATRQNTKKGEKREKPLYAPVYAKLIIRFLRSIGRLTEIRGSLSCGEGVDKISKEMREFAAQAFQSVPRPAGGLPAAETEAEKAFSWFLKILGLRHVTETCFGNITQKRIFPNFSERCLKLDHRIIYPVVIAVFGPTEPI